MFMKRRGKTGTFVRDEAGTQLVELAIALPIFIVLFALTAEFARYFHAYSTLTNSLRGAARYATKMTTEEGDFVTGTRRLAVYGDLYSTAKGPILPDLSEGHIQVERFTPWENTSTIRVRVVGYKYTPVFDLGKVTGVSSLTTGIPMSPEITMRQLILKPGEVRPTPETPGNGPPIVAVPAGRQ
jgi:Flp pilus assembly protein TadG